MSGFLLSLELSVPRFFLMPVVGRIDWISRQLDYGRSMHLVLSSAADVRKMKFKFVLNDPSDGAAGDALKLGLQPHLLLLRQLASTYCVMDRGHKHSTGHSVISFWVDFSVPLAGQLEADNGDDGGPDDSNNDHGAGDGSRHRKRDATPENGNSGGQGGPSIASPPPRKVSRHGDPRTRSHSMLPSLPAFPALRVSVAPRYAQKNQVTYVCSREVVAPYVKDIASRCAVVAQTRFERSSMSQADYFACCVN